MKQPPLYSRSSPPPAPVAQAAPADVAPAQQKPRRFARVRRHAGQLALGFLLLAALAWMAHLSLQPRPYALTQKEIDQAVLHTLATKELPSQAARAAAAVAPSVVRVVSYGPVKGDARQAVRKKDKGALSGGTRKGAPKTDDAAKDEDKDQPQGLGTGVVIVDNGTILTSLHVVASAHSVKVIFADGLESVADVTGVQPENDLAVLKARKIPDDLQPATLRSTSDLAPGDEVVAVGHPFGIGPSVSAGVISGFKREFQSPEGERLLTNLIQFDAAANPGNSGGPLVTMDGAVVGIVAAILNPSARTFAGIGFAVPIENAAAAVGMSPF
ncbi:MAG: trypsin-like peptidase domain-containing protein [Rhodocyclaceae bacterium]